MFGTIRLGAELEHAAALVAGGRFAEAYEALDGLKSPEANRPWRRVLTAEVALAIGEIESARRVSEELLSETAPPLVLARALRILAKLESYEGNLSACRHRLETAEAICEEHHLNEESAEVLLADLSATLSFSPIEHAMARLPAVRKAVARAGRPETAVGLRLLLAKVEARRQALSMALKHIRVATELLSSHPNPWLQGACALDRSNIEALSGDLEASLSSAEEAVRHAASSGHARTFVAAQINISHILGSQLQLPRARKHVAEALRAARNDVRLQLAALDSEANLLISAGDLASCKVVFARATQLVMATNLARHSWDRLAEASSRARLAMAEQNWTEAARWLTQGIEIADASGDVLWRKRFSLNKARCLGALGYQEDCARELSRGTTPGAASPEFMVLYSAAVAAATPCSSAKEEHTRLALGICAGLGNGALAGDVLIGLQAPSTPDSPPPQNLDTAVALLELGGHPHVLAREAVAVLDGAGCVSGLAVVAVGQAGPRVIETRGWDDRRARAWARNPDGCEIIPLGEHRDEPWQILAEPRPGLDHRCTFIAIRKLLDTAVTLDRYRRDEKQRAALWPAESLDGEADAIWASEPMSEVLHIARRIAPTPLTVLVTGETGSGKEVLARTIHRASDRAAKPFLPFNCTAVPRDMLESQLFGHRKGAFTGADTAFAGVIRAAAGGTLFLDEIGEVPLDLQPKLLRFLETHEIHPLGEPQPVTVDVRVIAATNAPLEQLVAEGRLREDLFYRLNVIRLQLPPLRERREEIPPLVEHYLRRCSDEQKKGRLTISDETLEYLLLYRWPGNLRQLANEIRRAVAIAEPDSVITPAHLSPEIQSSRRTIAAPPQDEAEVRLRIDQPLPAAVEYLEQVMVRNALTRAHGRVEEAARLLGISRKGLFLKRRRWGISGLESS